MRVTYGLTYVAFQESPFAHSFHKDLAKTPTATPPSNITTVQYSKYEHGLDSAIQVQ